MKKRTILFSSIGAVLVAAVSIGATSAYFTSQTEPVTNIITMGNVTVELREPAWTDGGEATADSMSVGETANKDPQVYNSGLNPCYVRLSVTGVSCGAGDTDITVPGGGFDVVGERLGLDANKWTSTGDGYFYYNQILERASATTPLFTGVKLTNAVLEGNLAQLDIVITAEAVQCEGEFAPEEGISFLASAKAAFEEQMVG